MLFNSPLLPSRIDYARELPPITFHRLINANIRQKRRMLIAEFLEFLKHNKKRRRLPIVIILMIMGFMIVLSSTAISPFLYPLF